MKILAVHYKLDNEEEAVQHFIDLGFRGVRDLHIDPTPINCNSARTQVHDAAEKEEDTEWYFSGNYDWNTGNVCRIYTFTADVMPVNRG